jgi:inhibitor of cysteine peptidase
MKRVWLLVTLVVLTLGLVAGCVGVKTYKSVGEDIKIGVGQEFIIALGSNDTTGYSWEASYDESMLELVGGKSTYEVDEVGDDVVGAGGTEFFRFLTLAAGETEITLTYERSFEDVPPVDTKVFTVVIE